MPLIYFTHELIKYSSHKMPQLNNKHNENKNN